PLAAVFVIMEEFIETVESQVFLLNHIDAVAGISSLQFVLVYENQGGSADFMPSGVLEQSFYKTLQHFPILVGHIKELGNGYFSAAVDKENLNMPEYRESTSSIHYSELKAANFSWDKWPGSLATSPVINVNAAGVITNVKVDVIRLKDNSGLIISPAMAHMLVDSVGYFDFVNLWASICAQMRSGQVVATAFEAKPTSSRSVIAKSLPTERKAVDPGTAWFFTHYSLLSKFFAWMSLTTRLRLLNLMLKSVSSETHIFHISRESLDLLHTQVKEFVPSNLHISDNDLLSALLSKTFAQSEAANDNNKGLLANLTRPVFDLVSSLVSGKNEKEIVVAIACSFRPRLGIADANYTGNCTVCPCDKYQSSELDAPTTPRSIATIAKRVRQLVDTVDATYLAGLLDVMNSNPTFHMQLFSCAANYPTLILTNHTKLKMYSADFGDGIQQWSSFIPRLNSNVVMIQPCPPPATGYNIFVDAPVETMKNMLKNEFWMAVTEVVN
ncbi:hypothetical protein GGI12_005106, partial [Dipsacomyces acuminosporus]